MVVTYGPRQAELVAGILQEPRNRTTDPATCPPMFTRVGRSTMVPPPPISLITFQIMNKRDTVRLDRDAAIFTTGNKIGWTSKI